MPQPLLELVAGLGGGPRRASRAGVHCPPLPLPARMATGVLRRPVRSAWLWELKGPVLLLLSLALNVLARSMPPGPQEAFRSFPRTAMRRKKQASPLVPFQTGRRQSPRCSLPAGQWQVASPAGNGKKEGGGLGAHPERPHSPLPPASLNSLPPLIAGP